MSGILHQIINFLLETVSRLGYPGIILLMALESSFFPFPSEVVIPPAAYLASKGHFSLFGVIASGIFGSLLGAWVNYFLAIRLGRPLVQRFIFSYGRYLFLGEHTLGRVENFFDRHGHISTFIGRLLPGIRQYISLPAGLAKMNFLLFSLYTALGAGIWVCVLALAGYLVGANEVLLRLWIKRGSWFLIAFCGLLVAIYLYFHLRSSSGEK